jgi:hypothetical protein
MPPVSEIFRVFQPASLKIGICCGLQKFCRKVPLQIVIGWTGQAGRLLNLPPPIRKTKIR